MAYDKLRDRAKKLSTESVKICPELKKRRVDGSSVQQIWKAGTSVFANVNEAHAGQGRNDFATKLQVALKECRECDGWFEVLYATGYVSKEEYKRFHNLCFEIGCLLSASIRTARDNEERAQREKKEKRKRAQKEKREKTQEKKKAEHKNKKTPEVAGEKLQAF